MEKSLKSSKPKPKSAKVTLSASAQSEDQPKSDTSFGQKHVEGGEQFEAVLSSMQEQVATFIHCSEKTLTTLQHMGQDWADFNNKMVAKNMEVAQDFFTCNNWHDLLTFWEKAHQLNQKAYNKEIDKNSQTLQNLHMKNVERLQSSLEKTWDKLISY